MHKSSLILFNISKSRNFGGIIRTANALGVSEIIIIGRKKFTRYGNFGTYENRKIRHFFTLGEAVSYLKQSGYTIVGVEIDENSVSVEKFEFNMNCAFMFGNEGTGLSSKQREACNSLIYIKQYGLGASLNVNVAAGIIFNYFSIYNNYSENTVENCKFIK